MHRKLCAFVFFLFVTVFSAFSEDTEWYWDQPISKIDFTGLKNVKKSDLQGLVSSFIGQSFTVDVYNDILDRLYSLDFFDEISPGNVYRDGRDNSKVFLVLDVVERPVITAINFIGNRKIRNGELREQIKNKTSDIFIESKILLDERVIRNYYLQKGYTASYITHSTEETADGIIVNRLTMRCVWKR